MRLRGNANSSVFSRYCKCDHACQHLHAHVHLHAHIHVHVRRCSHLLPTFRAQVLRPWQRPRQLRERSGCRRPNRQQLLAAVDGAAPTHRPFHCPIVTACRCCCTGAPSLSTIFSVFPWPTSFRPFIARSLTPPALCLCGASTSSSTTKLTRACRIPFCLPSPTGFCSSVPDVCLPFPPNQ